MKLGESMGNKYIFRSLISEKKFREILKLFCLDIEAKKCSQLSNVNRNTINKIYDKIRGKYSKIVKTQTR